MEDIDITRLSPEQLNVYVAVALREIRGDVKEMKDGVTGPDGCQRQFGGRIGHLEGELVGVKTGQRLIWKVLMGGGGLAALSGGIGKALGWF